MNGYHKGIDWPAVLASAVKRGVTAAELSRELGVTRQTASTTAKRHRVVLVKGDHAHNKGKRKMTRADLAHAAQHGMSFNATCVKFGVSGSALIAAEKAYNLRLRRSGAR